MRDYFNQFGEILEAVIISDKLNGRSKGYGFVSFKDAEAAKKACEDATPVINGRRANCNLAWLGARRPRPAAVSAATVAPSPPKQGSTVVPRSSSPAPSYHVQWYYPPASPYHHHHQQHNPQTVPFYGYSPAYVAADVSYNHKLGYTGGSYVNGGGGHFSPQVFPGGHVMVGANVLMGLPAHMFPATIPGPVATVPALITKPASVARNSGLPSGIGRMGLEGGKA